MDNGKQILNYWRNSLADASRMSIPAAKLNKALHIDSSIETGTCFERGTIPQAKAQILLDEKKDELKKLQKKSKPGANEKEAPITTAQVLVSPIRLCKVFEHGKRKADGKNETAIHPMWVPAQVDETGQLSPVSDLSPWISRDVLEPVQENTPGDPIHFTLGTVDAVDEFLTQHEPQTASWDTLQTYCKQFFKHVSGQEMEEFTMDGFFTDFCLTVLLDTSFGDSSDGIIQLYDQILANNTIPPLLQQCAQSQPTSNPAPSTINIDYLQSSAQHVGSMGYQFALSESQRQVLYHFFKVSPGEMLAVNGPPGTGKTTLLQSVVANAVVESAIEGKAPVVMAVSSTNNQAIENIIESFGNAQTKPGKLAGRWLPDLHSYALLLPTSAKEDFTKNTHYIRLSGEGSPGNMEEVAYCEKAKTEFLTHCNEYAGYSLPTVSLAVDFLHQQLLQKTEAIKKCSRLSTELRAISAEMAAYEEFGGITAYRTQLEEDQKKQTALLDRLHGVADQWITELRSESFLTELSVMMGMTSVKMKREARYRLILANCPVPVDNLDCSSTAAIENFIAQHMSASKKMLENIQTKIEVINSLLKKQTAAESDWVNWKALHNLRHDPPEILAELDTELRHDAFQLATHYWEGRWLLEMDSFFELNLDKAPKNKVNMEARWRRYAMLTPCFVATFYMLPKFFRYYTSNRDPGASGTVSLPLLEFIDILMVDEAGQVPAEIGAASFVLAKKAIIVGDIKQIEPVRHAIGRIDVGNMHRSGLLETWRDEKGINRLHQTGVSALAGSVMKMAQNRSRYTLEGQDEPGMFLAEHRRCYNEIIGYCNEVAYQGKLIPMRGASEPDKQLFPPMGYANVNSVSTPHYSSMKNPVEAEAIARWLQENQKKIEDRYGAIEEAVGIITPFNAQGWELKQALEKVEIASRQMKIGTIHALQGAERPIIIFSPVYGYDASGGLWFINRQINMLNVAVSRAKDSFLVFGNMNIFNPSQSTPTGKLAKFLFADESNELAGIPPQKRQEGKEDQGGGEEIVRIDKLSTFRHVLKKSIEKSAHSIMIVSPCISIAAIEADGLEPPLKEAVARGVQITVYTDENLDCPDYRLKPNADAGRKLLEQCGVELKVIQGIHNKTLCVDDRYLAEGSFNWLSASRDPESCYCRHEVAFGYKGNKVAGYIKEAVEQMETIAKKQ